MNIVEILRRHAVERGDAIAIVDRRGLEEAACPCYSVLRREQERLGV